MAMQNRPLRPFEQGAHLHVLDWAHTTARYRFQHAGAAQVKAAAGAIVHAGSGGNLRPPELPALEAAITGELRNLYALGHATVRSELDHQESGDELPIGLSAETLATTLDLPVSPPNLRKSTSPEQCCGTCKMFDPDRRVCWSYEELVDGSWQDYRVMPDDVCDSWSRSPSGQKILLAASDAVRQPGRLRARAKLVAQHVAHEIWQAIHRGRLGGVTQPAQLRQLGSDAGTRALSVAATHHAGGAINAGREAAAEGRRAEIIGARYTSVLDKNTCGPCADADTGELLALDSPEWVPTPNPACLGGDRCRCIHVYQLSTEGQSVPEAIAASR